MTYGINLNDDQINSLVAHFDRDGNKTVSFDEFLRAIRGQLNDFRLGLIRAAYEKLDVNGDGSVKLDDIAQLYSVAEHPDVLAGGDPKDVYMKFMSLWDTQVADGIVTFDEFCDYFRDVSASVDEDAYFEVMMKNAWKL